MLKLVFYAIGGNGAILAPPHRPATYGRRRAGLQERGLRCAVRVRSAWQPTASWRPTETVAIIATPGCPHLPKPGCKRPE
jgi:hypothetical protein